MSGCPAIMRTQRVWREIAAALADGGFDILNARANRHLRVWVRRGGRDGVITCSSSPSCREHAVAHALKDAMRVTRPARDDSTLVNRDARVTP